MVTNRMHSPEHIVRSERHPGERQVHAVEKGRKHPSQLRRAETAVVRIIENIFGIVPQAEAAPEGGKKRDESNPCDEQRKETGTNFVDHHRGETRALAGAGRRPSTGTVFEAVLEATPMKTKDNTDRRLCRQDVIHPASAGLW